MDRQELEYVKHNYPILKLVRECQEERGYAHGVVQPEWERDQKTRCPVHDDQNPSGKAYYSTNSFYCWWCGRAWDVPGLYAEVFGVGLGEAVRVLLSRLGVAASAREVQADLRKVVAALNVKAPPVTREVAAAYREQLLFWAYRYANEYFALEDVIDDCMMPLFPEEPEKDVEHLRGMVEWAQKMHANAIPPPPVESPVVKALIGV